LASTEDYDVIVLDLMLPQMDGLTICKKLRDERNHSPILILTARGSVDNKVDGLNAGADDYLAKPFAFSELLARIKALLRRPKQALDSVLKVSDLTLNSLNFVVTRSGRQIELSKTEYALLEYLMHHKDKVLSKEQIINHVWNYDADVLPNTVEVYMGYLRKKINKVFPDKPELIQTVRGFGYKISDRF
jgi:DNA-binding response OmpR family regulator